MKREPETWLTTEQVALRAGMTAEWTRLQIKAGRLPATVWSFGSRPTYRIRESDWLEFQSRYSRKVDGDA
jgi:hypothetical protein